jgi:hypothetical protein
MKDYWKDDGLLKISEEKLKEELNYEFWMFTETCERLNQCQNSEFERNLLLESLAIHSRLLIDFFYGDKNPKYPNDLIAQDFLSDDVNWKKERPPQTQLLIDAKYKADKQLAHLSRWRIKIEQDGKRGWDWNAIKIDMKEIIKKFENLRNRNKDQRGI